LGAEAVEEGKRREEEGEEEMGGRGRK